ncbi:hypothetical protein PFISCL1PPCAC_19426, partial [Pristionchus fissidentatus]
VTHVSTKFYKIENNEQNAFRLEVAGNDSVLLSEAEKAVVRLAHAAEFSADGVAVDLSGNHTASLRVDIDEVDLDGSVVIGGNETRRGRALAGNVELDGLSAVVFHF